MTCETHEAFLELRHKMVFAHQQWHHHSIKYKDYGKDPDQVRTEIAERGYYRSHQHDLDIILKFLKRVNDSELSEKLQNIIDSLGNPQHN